MSELLRLPGSGSDDLFGRPDSKKETMFVVPLYPITEAIFNLQKQGVNLDDYVLVVPTSSDNQYGYGKFYIADKRSIK